MEPFRQFVRGFYTAPFRDLFFSANPPERMFRAVVTVLAGYWQPSLATRIWLRLLRSQVLETLTIE